MLKQLSEAVGLLAAVVGAVYLLGAGVLAARLQVNDLPTLSVISNLPRELVISYGLTYAVVWWLLAAALVAVVWLALRRAPSARLSRRRRSERWLGGAVILTVLAGLSLVFVEGVLDHLEGRVTWWDRLGVAAAVVVAGLLARGVWRVLAARYRREWSAPTWVAVAAVLSGLVVVPAFMEIGIRAPLDEAQLCVEGPTHLSGWLIGEAGDRVYIGEDRDPHRIVAAPRDGELYVGPNATEDLLCRAERARMPTADELAAAQTKACAKCKRPAIADILVSGRQSRFASALVDRRRTLFRRAAAEWRVVASPRLADSCESLQSGVGVSARVGDELRLCTPAPS